MRYGEALFARVWAKNIADLVVKIPHLRDEGMRLRILAYMRTDNRTVTRSTTSAGHTRPSHS
jgi:hypothetical protein